MHDSVALAALLNARGLMELILLDIGRGDGIITPQLYTVLTVMTIVTTLATSPLYLWARRHWPDAAEIAPHPSVLLPAGPPARSERSVA